MRAIRLAAENELNLSSLIFSPCLRALVIESIEVLINCLARFSVISMAFATVLTKQRKSLALSLVVFCPVCNDVGSTNLFSRIVKKPGGGAACLSVILKNGLMTGCILF